MLKIAVCDSGVGGLAVLKRLYAEHPNFNYYYFSDRRNLPYGNKSDLQIKNYCREFIQKAVFVNADALVVACNTMSLIGYEIFLKEAQLPVFFVRPSLWDICQNNYGQNIKILCTVASAKSFAHNENFRINPDILVPFKNLANEVEINLFALEKINVERLKKRIGKADKIFLACTHYLHLKSLISCLYPRARVFDGCEELLKNFSLLSKLVADNKNGQITFCGEDGEYMKRSFWKLLRPQK